MSAGQMPKPLPTPTPTSAEYWAGLRVGEVRIQKCGACAKSVFYPRSNCPYCLSQDLKWERVSGNGTVYTFTIARRPTAPMFADEVPQKLVVVELDEGPRLTSTLVNVDPADVRIGMRVKPVFEEIQDSEVTLLRFEPA